MSARLTRPPTGKSNAAFNARPQETNSFSRPLSARSPRLVAITSTRSSVSQGLRENRRPSSARPMKASEPETISGRSDASSTAEFLLTRSKDYTNRMKDMERASTENLGDYNEYSRPKPSMHYPLRSVLLDPEANNFRPSRTRKELMKNIKDSGMPHRSYDIDGDGWVSREDYFIAKRFDLDGNGIIDPDEKLVAKKIIAEEFFNAHMHHIHLFGKKYANRSLKENVNNLAKSAVFERTYNKLKATELKLKQGGSSEMVEGMTLADKRLLKYNFYCDKFDTTAWNDYEAIPRAENFTLPTNGSRKQMLFARKQADVDRNDQIFRASRPKTASHFGRVNLITNPAVENN